MSSLPTDTSQILKAPAGESEIVEMHSLHDWPKGDCNENPSGIGLLALLAEDFQNHGRKLREPGFWAVAVHRIGNACMGIRFKFLRKPLLMVVYKFTHQAIIWLWGIDLPYTTKLGRRVRIWHHGGIWLGARSIGDDVHIRHNTTFGVLNRHDLRIPIIGNRVDVAPGVCILGAITVGDDCVIGPNSVVVRDLQPRSVVMGVPARQAALWKDGEPHSTAPKSEDASSGEEIHG